MAVSGTRGPIPLDPNAMFAEWRNTTESRLKALEGATGSKIGIVYPVFTIDSNSSAYTAGQTTDFVISDIDVSDSRVYRGNFHSEVSIDTATTWAITFRVDSVTTQSIWQAQVVSGSGSRHISANWLWFPTTGTKDLGVRVVTGGGTITFVATAEKPRQFWIEDVGVRQ